MEQSDTEKTETKTLSVLERFRQLSKQKEQSQEKPASQKEVASIVLMGSNDSTGSKGQDNDHSPKETFRGRQFRGNKRPYEHPRNRQSTMHQGLKEHELGMTEYVTSRTGFNGIIKQRFSDFQVNEIDLDGNIIKLTNNEIAQDKEIALVNDTSLLSEEQWNKIKEIYETNSEEVARIDVTDVNKDKRSDIHKLVKQNFGVRMYSNTIDVDGRKFMEIGVAKKIEQRLSWPRNRGEFLHFVVHKQNTDSTETVHTLASYLKIKANKFSYAGTKDKRAVTTQIMCVRRLHAEKLRALDLRNIYLGNFEYKFNCLRLGDLKGNRFRIALREVTADTTTIKEAVASLEKDGFLNYFGTQRFGASRLAPTHEIGKEVLKNNWKNVVEMILKPRPNEKGFAEITAARDVWWKTRDPAEALKCLFRKDKSIEGKILIGLKKNGVNGYLNALQMLPRNTIMLYAHAYQSLIWNKIVSRRIKEFGISPLAGDLVIDQESANVERVVQNGEEIEKGDAEEDEEEEDEFQKEKVNVRVLSEEEAKVASINDIVYPLPGCDITYPNNVIAQWYTDMLAEDGLTSESLGNKNRLFRLYGTYRKIIIKPTDITWKTISYNEHNQDLILTDLQKLNGDKEPISQPDGKHNALIVEFSLGPGIYATMALREMLKCETSTAHQAALSTKTLLENEELVKKRKLEKETIAAEETVANGVNTSQHLSEKPNKDIIECEINT